MAFVKSVSHTATQSDKFRMDARKAIMLTDSNITTNDGLVILHIQWMRGVGRAEGTIRGRRATLRRLERHGGQNPAGVTESQVESYLAMRRTGEGKGGRPVSDSTIANDVSHLKEFFAWLQRYDYRPASARRKSAT